MGPTGQHIAEVRVVQVDQHMAVVHREQGEHLMAEVNSVILNLKLLCGYNFIELHKYMSAKLISHWRQRFLPWQSFGTEAGMR